MSGSRGLLELGCRVGSVGLSGRSWFGADLDFLGSFVGYLLCVGCAGASVWGANLRRLYFGGKFLRCLMFFLLWLLLGVYDGWWVQIFLLTGVCVMWWCVGDGFSMLLPGVSGVFVGGPWWRSVGARGG